MGHPNLSDELNRIVEMGQDPNLSLSLRKVTPGEIVAVQFSVPAETGLGLTFFQVDEPPTKEAHGALCHLLYGLFPRDWIHQFISKGIPLPHFDQRCTLAGACTKNPSAPLGATMIQLDTITVGRHLLWYMPDELRWIFKEQVAKVRLGDLEEFQKMRNHLENDGRFQPFRIDNLLTDEQSKQQESLRQPIKVRTRNSIYILGEEGQDRKRTLLRQNDGKGCTGRIACLYVGGSMTFDRDDGKFWRTSMVTRIESAPQC